MRLDVHGEARAAQRGTEREEEEASGFGKNAAACRHVVKVNLVPLAHSQSQATLTHNTRQRIICSCSAVE